MTTKTTLRLPEAVARQLRERSAKENRSLNDTAVRALLVGLGDDLGEDDWWRVYGDMVAIPPKRGGFDIEAHNRAIRGLGIPIDQVRLLMDEFERDREDRI